MNFSSYVDSIEQVNRDAASMEARSKQIYLEIKQREMFSDILADLQLRVEALEEQVKQLKEENHE